MGGNFCGSGLPSCPGWALGGSPCLGAASLGGAEGCTGSRLGGRCGLEAGLEAGQESGLV